MLYRKIKGEVTCKREAVIHRVVQEGLSVRERRQVAEDGDEGPGMPET